MFNAVLFHGNLVDDLMLYGRGAGKLPTGSAVVADMVTAVCHEGGVPIRWSSEVEKPVPSFTAGGKVNWCNKYGNQYRNYSKN